MKSLDLVKKTQDKKKEKKIQKENFSFSKKNQPKAIVSQNHEQQSKKATLWILVTVSMVIVIAGWLFFLPKRFSQNSGQGGGFQEITKEFGNFFGTIDKTFKENIEKFQNTFPSLPNLKNMNEEELKNYLEQLKIKELEKKVFPQFENINLNVNK